MPSIARRAASPAAPVRKSIEYPIAESIGYLIGVTDRKLQASLERQTRDQGITYGTWFFLRALWEVDGVGITDLARRVGTSTPTAMSAVRKLAALDMVTIDDHPEDGRRVVVRLTKKGASLEGRLLDRMETLNKALLKGLTREEADKLRAMLRTIQANAAATSEP